LQAEKIEPGIYLMGREPIIIIRILTNLLALWFQSEERLR